MRSLAGSRLQAQLTPSPNVLIVDDVKANLALLEALLEDMGCNVISAHSGAQALELVERYEFALVLLDVHMPMMNGYEVAEHVSRGLATRHVPILLVTATHHSEINVLKGYGSGAVDYLQKPIDPTVLRAKVRVFLDLFLGRKALEKAYKDLQSVQAQLIQSAKMSSLGELVAGVAHEINNPLAFVTSHLDTVVRALDAIGEDAGTVIPKAQSERWERARNRLGEMRGGLDRMRDLVLKLRTFSRLDEGERKLVSVRECVASVLTILGHRLRGKIDVQVQVAEPDELECYPALFNQALANLVTNAADAMNGHGRLAIHAGREGAFYVVSVADTGPGIPASLRERVLEPFFTTKAVGEGTGLGLSITHSIVEKHGGTLELVDAEGGGARVVMRIPLLAGERGGA
jgi:two-component system NtrC family sensor kinase